MSRLSSEENRLIEAASALVVEEVAPRAAAWERGDGDCRDALPMAASLGLTGLQVPTKHGGLGYSFACKTKVAEVLGGGDFGFAMTLINTHNIAECLAQNAPSDIARHYVPKLLAGQLIGCTALTEPGAGSDFAAISTKASAVPGGWKLDGQKAWITNAAYADVMLVYAQTSPGSGASGIAGFLVYANRAGFHRDPKADVGGVRSMGTGGFRMEGYLCSADEMLFPPGQAFKRALRSINGARVYVASMSCGMVAESLRVVSEYGRSRRTFGSTLQEHQGWRWSLANAAVDLGAARALIDSAATDIDAGVEVQGSAARAKIFATRMAQEHLSNLLHAMGAEGLREKYPMLRHIAGVQAAALADGSTEMLLERVAREFR